MELEQRVQMLEQEVQILKSQIQATLLTIQEQLLTNAYPNLRAPAAADTSPQNSVSPVIEAAEETEETIDAPAPSVRRVTLEDIQAKKKPPTNTRPEAAESWEKLERWALRRVEKMGVERTVQLVQDYAEMGRFTIETCDRLLDFLAECPRAAQPEPPHHPPKPAALKLPEPAAQAKAAHPAQPTRQAKPASRPTAVVKPAAPDSPSNSQLPQEGPDSKNNVVLRLIAGVSNAGAGVRWRKENG